jgi:tetratricopeptide (TPR) repeat protein
MALLLGAMLLLLLFLPWSGLAAGLRRNRQNLTVLPAAVGGTRLSAEEGTLGGNAATHCRSQWLFGIARYWSNPEQDAGETWEQALLCAPEYIDLVRAVANERTSLAELATRLYPQRAEAWFWLGELQTETSPVEAAHAYRTGLQSKPHDERAWIALGIILSKQDAQAASQLYDELHLEELAGESPSLAVETQFLLASAISQEEPERAIQLYQDGLQRKPTDGIRWRELGDLLYEKDPQAAIEAYLQSCHRGDPGSNGCYRAGRTAEELGDLEAAIRYYRLSQWSRALERADELEKQLLTTTPIP